MSRFATGVTIVTTLGREGEPVGLTVNSFASVSLRPALVLVCLDEESSSRERILETGFFCVNVLPEGDEEVARRFATAGRKERFRGLTTSAAPRGSPVLGHALAWAECEIRAVHPAGDHVIVVGEVLDVDYREGRPLLFFRGEYMGIER